MAKNCVITLDDRVVDKAAVNAHKKGNSLKQVIEDAIIDTALTETEEQWVTEKVLEAEPWAPSRVALWNMRRNGRLIQGTHYKKDGKFIFYDKAALKKELDKGSESKAPISESNATPGLTMNRYNPGSEEMGGSDYPV